ncbi:MAG: adenylate/guanylate cyclase domain-containing protein [Deltaproteobacteria bacterium]|nr:adenylate/guanylate cyclase domain-containing protein [Deltaproteobacteria bacterium]MBW2395917.1 adenylate/guanylate cyclase domain-containing protein [Deltaproteobacteria bacterium]
MHPRTRYAKSGDVHIAYQVFGDGPLDMVVIPGFISNVEMPWEWPEVGRFFEHLGSFARVIAFDKRGTGLSDRGVGVPTIEERMDDVRAVMDAAGSERAALFGISEGGPMSIVFAATYPKRTHSLVLLGSFARFSKADDYPCGLAKQQLESMFENIENNWGTGNDLGYFAPSMAGDEWAREQWGRVQRLGAGPREAAAIIRMNEKIDVRPVLETLHVPTLVIHRIGDRIIDIRNARLMAERIPEAQLLELSGDDHLPYFRNSSQILDAIQEFVTGSRSIPVGIDRVLATVLFTDIVDSTVRAVELGDRRWRELLCDHHARVREELRRYRGQEVDTAGDGFFATFDGPARAIRCARAIRDSVESLDIRLRAGLHTGECELHEGGVAGIAVHIGSRVAALANAGEVLVSSTVRDLVAGSGIEFQERGPHQLKGIPGEWQLYQVTD